jgi:membrane-bound lytic murein transglycosylase F
MQWIIRPDGRDLLAAANQFLATAAREYPPPSSPELERTPTAIINDFDASAFTADIVERLPLFRPAFEAAAQETGIDWRLLAALGYQESRWQEKARSPNGAEGLMMLMPRTARMLGVKDSFDATENIRAGSRYLADLHGKLPARIPEPDRMWMAIAAYNMGFGHLEDARVLTVRQGGNPDAWIDVRERLTLLSEEFWYLQVRHGYARGWETKLMLDRIQQFLSIIRAIHDQEQEVEPAEILTSQVGTTQAGDVSTRMRAERQVPTE